MAQVGNEKKKKKLVCYLGDHFKEECSLTWFKGNKENQNVMTFEDCTADVSDYLKSLGVSRPSICPNATEQWLIMDRIKINIPNKAIICPKHRLKFGIGWKSPTTCQYPGHIAKKGKKKAGTGRLIPSKVNLEINSLFSSAAKSFRVPIGSQWCNNCRLRVHRELVTKNKHILELSGCEICMQTHEDDIGINESQTKEPVVPLDAVMSSPVLSDDADGADDLSFLDETDESGKDTFNKSMSSISSEWTPIKYQLRTDFTSLVKKTQKQLVRKSLIAVDNVLNNIAPGQVDQLRKSITEKPTCSSDIKKDLQHAVSSPTSINTKVQLLSIFCTKKDDEYEFTIAQMMEMFPGTTKHQIERARKHAAMGLCGAPIEPGKYFRVKLKDEQINHFLDFIQFGGLIQDVASGTRLVKLSSNRKVAMPNVIRTVHKAEVIRLYEGACDRDGYNKNTGRPSTRTLWNILNNCPASQRKSLAGLDNVAAEGSDAFDLLTNIMQFVSSKAPHMKSRVDGNIRDLVDGKRYLKGEYKVNCADENGSEVADHCRFHALSDPREPLFQKACSHEHKKRCNDCDSLKQSLADSSEILKTATNLTPKERSNLEYDLKEAEKSIYTWKAHILTIINQEKQKKDILKNLDTKTAFIIVDFAMKFLSRRYRESMAKWFGKSGHGMHVLCCIFKNEEGQLLKRTYIAFIGKASQDKGAVMAIYEACLRQIKIDSPQIKFIIDKSDNAGCYHNEVIFAWKAHWPGKNLGIQFLETMFNERQAGKDQCDRDSATAKRQMNYHIDRGQNIESASEMNEALRAATALCGFNSCVMEIKEKKTYAKQKNIKDISKVHCVKYITGDNGKMAYHVKQYYEIGEGKKFNVGEEPISVTNEVTIPFKQEHLSVGKASRVKSKSNEIIYCSEPMCIKTFPSVDSMIKHLDFGNHEYQATKSSRLAKVKDQWVKRFVTDGDFQSLPGCSRSTPELPNVNQPKFDPLQMGWALPKRTHRRLTSEQKSFLNKIFDNGESTSSKATPENTLQKMKETFDSKDFLPVTTIKSYFSRRAKKIRSGDVDVGDENEDEESDEEEFELEQSDEEECCDEEERQRTVSGTKHCISKVPDLKPDDWIAVAFTRAWYPGQFIEYDDETLEVYVNFLDRTTSNAKSFVWPALDKKMEEDKCWVNEDDVVFKLSQPSQGHRDTLTFDEFEEVNQCYIEWKKNLKKAKK